MRAGSAGRARRDALAALARLFRERLVDPALRLGRTSHDQRPVQLLDPLAAERLGQLRRDGRRPRHHQQPARVPIQAMHEARPLAARGPRLEHAVDVPARPGAALDREAGRLVEHDQRVVLVQDARAQPFGIGRIDRVGPARAGAAGRWSADSGGMRMRLAGAEARIGLRAPAIHPHLAGAQQLLQPAMADLGEMTPEPAIEADLALVGADRPGLDLAHQPPAR